ncbi:MAG: class I tRNA ligase family protein, partial [Cyanobacteriota bacterium]|nr:class I tRNA ligase family protein [Cyanobacteriota bacterium]
LGWPEKTPDLATYFPTNTLSTGFDIIFFWVARMTMMAGYFMDQMPFKAVYIHGLILDENGKKMSKTAGNGIDPLLLINKYGTDAVRYTLIREVIGAGQDIRLEYDREKEESASVEASRNFTNKIWNASRFVMMNLDGKTPQQFGKPDKSKLELCDKWILSRFHKTVKQTCDYLDRYGIGEAAREQYEFIWGDFCDWYIELVKPRLQGENTESKLVAQQTLAYVLEGILKLLHPFMPHITEEIWHTLTQTGEETCLAVQSYPPLETDLINDELETEFELIFGTIRTLRNLRADADIKPKVKVTAVLQSENKQEREILTKAADYLKDLVKIETLNITETVPSDLGQTIAGVIGTIQALIPLAGVVDLEGLKKRTEKKLTKVEKEIESISKRLSNRNFVDKADPEVVQTARDALAEAEKQAEILRDRIQQLQSAS